VDPAVSISTNCTAQESSVVSSSGQWAVHAAKSIGTLVLAFILVMQLGCRNEPTSPQQRDDARVVVSSDVWGEFRTAVSVVGKSQDPKRSRTIVGSLESATLLPNNMLLMGVVRADAQRELVAVDARTVNELWRRTVSIALVPTEQAGIGLRSLSVLAASRDGQWVYAAQAERNGVVGITRLNSLSGVAEAFSGPWQVGGQLLDLPNYPDRPNGALAMVASRENSAGGPLRSARIYLLDRLSLAPFDSIPFSALNDAQAVINLVALQDQGTLLIGTAASFSVFDLRQRRVVASRPRLGLGALVPFQRSTRFAALDQGRFPEGHGTGTIYLFDDQLAMIDSIDVSTPLGGFPHSTLATLMGDGVVDEAAGELYVRTGSAPFGLLSPVRPARVIVVSLESRRVDRIISLPGDNIGFAFLITR
jgi:hypothetical protein